MYIEAIKSLLPLWTVFFIALLCSLSINTKSPDSVWVIGASLFYLFISFGAVVGAIWYREK